MGVMAEPDNAQLINRKVPKKAKNTTSGSKPNVTMPYYSKVSKYLYISPLRSQTKSPKSAKKWTPRE
jgi:hypothetical protein